jgi:hypothetical protein
VIVPHLCAEAHQHEPNRCCDPDCWCNRPALHILGNGNRILSHEPNAECAIEGWHQRETCTALNGPNGPRPTNVVAPTGGKPL